VKRRAIAGKMNIGAQPFFRKGIAGAVSRRMGSIRLDSNVLVIDLVIPAASIPGRSLERLDPLIH